MKGMYFYYLRDKDNKPVVSVCLKKDDENDKLFHRGISVCSMRDNCEKAHGRYLAITRSLRAQKNRKKSCDKIKRQETIDLLKDLNCNFSSKSSTLDITDLCDYEKKILKVDDKGV